MHQQLYSNHRNGISLTRPPVFCIPRPEPSTPTLTRKRTKTSSSKQHMHEHSDKENMEMLSNKVQHFEDVHETSTPQKVHFGQNVVLCKKSSKNGGPSSEPRKSILKRKSLFSSPVQNKTTQEVEEQTQKRMTDEELKAKIAENYKRLEAIKKIIRKYEYF